MPQPDSAMFYFKTNKLGFDAEFFGRVKLVAALADLGGGAACWAGGGGEGETGEVGPPAGREWGGGGRGDQGGGAACWAGGGEAETGRVGPTARGGGVPDVC
jgi:hypothetical protein